MAYANGRIPASFLVQAQNGAKGQMLEPQTAWQWAAMVAAAAADGVTLRPQSEDDGIASCYRSYENQVYAEDNAARLGVTAAYRGTSNHGFGTAIDISMGPGVFAWLSANAGRFGFDNVQGRASGENWHWVMTRVIRDISTISKEQLMAMKDTLEIFVTQKPAGPQSFVAGGGFYYPIGDKDGVGGQAKIDALTAIGVPTRSVEIGQYDVLNIIFAGNQYIYSTAQVAATEVKK